MQYMVGYPSDSLASCYSLNALPMTCTGCLQI